VASIAEVFNSSAPFILAPRLIISIWDTHAHDECVYINTTFEDCTCWTSTPTSDFDAEYELDSQITL